MAGQRKRWDRVTRRKPGWRRVAKADQLRYLVEPEDANQEPKPPVELRTTDPCAVGDVIVTDAVLSADHRKLRFVWKITARAPAEEPFAARLTVVPGKLASRWSRTFT